MAREPRAPQKHQPQQGGGGQPPASQVAWHARPQLPHETRPSQALQASLEEGPGADCSSSVSSQGAQQTRGAARLARGRLTCARPARVSEMAREPKSLPLEGGEGKRGSRGQAHTPLTTFLTPPPSGRSLPRRAVRFGCLVTTRNE